MSRPASKHLSILLALLVAGCGGDSTAPPDDGTPQQQGTIAGTVVSGGSGVSGVTVTLSGAASRTATTSATGAFTFSGLTPGAYTVTITLPGGFVLASGEQAAKPVTVSANATATATFSLAAAPGGSVTTIQLTGSSFSPSDVTVTSGTRVRWVNNSGVQHTVTPTGHSQWDDTTLNNGNSLEQVLTLAGTYNYRCTLHAGMTGVVRVQ